MTWLKHAIVDLVVVALIVVATVLDQNWARILVMIYTPLMIVLKILPLTPGALPVKPARAADAPPNAFYHVTYLANVALLGAYGQWLLAAGWVLIWVLSVAAEAKTRMPARAQK